MTHQGGAAVAVATGLLTATADAGVFFTIYTLNTPYTAASPNVTQVLMSWSTNLTSGTVEQDDLTDWSLSFLNGGNLFYTDNIVSAGSVQAIGGVSRGILDIVFNFNLDTFTACGSPAPRDLRTTSTAIRRVLSSRRTRRSAFGRMATSRPVSFPATRPSSRYPRRAPSQRSHL